MWSSVTADSQPTDVMEYVAQLRLENATLREVLSAGRHSLVSPVCSQGAQTDRTLADDDDEVNTSVSSHCETDAGSSVIEVSQHELTQPVTAQTASSPPSLLSAAPASDAVVNDLTEYDI